MNKSLVWGIVIIAVLALVAGFYFYTNMNPSTNSGQIYTPPTESPGTNSANAETNTIKIEAARFQYTPNAIHVKKGQHVKIMIDNLDFNHGISIPDLGLSGIDSVEFTADKVGTYQFRCPTPCGTGHRTMTGTLIIE